MPRQIRGERYTKDCSPNLIALLMDGTIACMSYKEAMEFYTDTVPRFKGKDIALLGCNDRFFLLTGILNRKDAMHPWVYDRAREIEADPDGYLDLWARGHYKSTLGTFAGIIQEVIIDPETTIGIFGNTKEISRPFLSQIKDEIDQNEGLRQNYDDVFWSNARKDAPSWSVERGLVVKRKGNPKEATVEAHGLIDAMPTGRHFRHLVYDDIITEKNVTSPEQIRKATERVELSDNLGCGNDTKKWFFGTRYSYADSYGQMIENGVVIPRLYPATDDGTLNGAPVMLTQQAWDEKKRTQRSQIAAQMLQNPLAGEQNTFMPKWLKAYWTRPPMLNIYIMGDPSKGRNKTSDRTAIVVMGMDPLGNKYLLDGYCHRMPLSERWNRLKHLHKRWVNMPGVQTVTVGWERYGMQSDDEYFDEKMRLDGYSFSIKELGWTGERGGESKTARVERLEPDFRQGNIFVPGRVYHPAYGGSARWKIHDGSDEIVYTADTGLHKDERRVKASGEYWRCAEALKGKDEDGNIYDLTRHFFQEFVFFPFSPHDDFIDAFSRIYDMDPMPSVRFERVDVVDYPDA